MAKAPPTVVVVGGPNGAGKTTVSRAILADTFGLAEFVNADALAAGLSGFNPDRAAFAAGRIMLQRLRELAAARTSFAFESTLASRTFAPWLAELAGAGWDVELVYFWLRSPELAIRRVKARVRKGGHTVPDDIIRRRYWRSVANFWALYRPLAQTWHAYDNSGAEPVVVAHGSRARTVNVVARSAFSKLLEAADARDETQEDDPAAHG
jgi:predicted ABC-type ATPase